MEKAYSYRFYPTPEQESLLRRTLGCVRLVYNQALHERTQAWYERQERVGYSQTSSMLTNWKKQEDLDFLNQVSCVPLQQGLRHLQTAFTNFFAGRAKYPNFKKKHQGGSAEFTKSAFKIKNGQIYLAKCLEPLAYKCRWYGRNYIEIDRWFPSSKRCSSCGHIVEKMPLNIREWDCPNCGTHHDRDLNASKNILAAGLAVSVCGASVRPEQSKSVKATAKKQKPKL